MSNASAADTRRPGTAAARRAPTGATAAIAVVALVDLALHLLIAGNYGYFRDELYYIAAGKHLDFGYVDFPLMTALLAALLRVTVGDSLVALHVVPALAGAALVALTGLIARALGGGRFAQGLAALAALVAPTFLGTASIFSMDALDELWWTLAAYLAVLILTRARQEPREPREPREREAPGLWLLIGLVFGVGLLTKLTILSFAGALFIGLLLTPNRAVLRTRWPWLAGTVALLGLLPYVGWQIAHGWPTLEFWRNYARSQAQSTTPVLFLVQQVLTMQPFTLPLWLAGLYYYLVSRSGRPYRALGWAFVILYALDTIGHAKFYFLAPAYPMLFAAGALVFERGLRGGRRWLRPTYAALLVLGGALLAPLVTPTLPPDIPMRAIGGRLPQPLADRFGWPAMVATVARVYHRLPPSERAQACVVGSNYGEAGAVDAFGPAYGLPHAISGHNTYYLWGPGACTGAVVIAIGWTPRDLATSYKNVVQAATVTCAECVREEDDLPVSVGRGLKVPLDAVWRSIRHYN